MRMVVRTWVARGNVPIGNAIPEGASTPVAPYDTPFESVNQMMNLGALPPYVNAPLDTAMTWTNINFNPLKHNPMWVRYWKQIKSKSYTLMPYATVTERLKLCKKRPAWLWRYGQGYQNPVTFNATDPAVNFTLSDGLLAFKDMGGVTTCYKTIEFVGEDIVDSNGVVGTAPCVFTAHNYISFECASPGPQALSWTDAPNTKPTMVSGLTGQTFNYMYPTPSSSSSLGSSILSGALTSGL